RRAAGAAHQLTAEHRCGQVASQGTGGHPTGRYGQVGTIEKVSSTPEHTPTNEGNGAYSASNITVLEGLEAVRLRPGMYIGSTGPAGLHHLIWEIVDNSVDEAMAGYATRIEVVLGQDGTCKVTDNGRGIPTDLHEKTGQSALTTVLTTLHAGGKFEEGAYAVSGGLHGVGVSVVNALSEWMAVEVRRDGRTWRQEFRRGTPQTPNPAEEETGEEGSGTTVVFRPDPEIFTETVVFDQRTVARRLREMAFLNKGLEIVLVDERVEEDGEPQQEERSGEGLRRQQIFRYDSGLEDFVHYLNEGKTTLSDEVIYLEASGEDTELEVAMQWTTGYQTTLLSFANTINTHEGGTHEEGFRKALTNAVNDFAAQRNLIRSGDPQLTG